MSANGRRRTGILVRKVFEILLNRPEGLHFREILLRIQKQWSREAGNVNGSAEVTISFPDEIAREVALGCVAPIKAGWLLSDNDTFALSAEGIEAYTRYEDAEHFMIEAARGSVQGWLSVYLPRWYSGAGKIKDGLTIEYRAARRIGLRRLIREAVGTSRPWQEILPIQAHQRVAIPGLEASDCKSLLGYVESLGLAYAEGRHAVYLPPETIKQSAFRLLADLYPNDAGLKIVKNQGGVNDSGYITGRTKGDSLIQLGAVHGHPHLSLVANLLYSKGIGPRLYDLVDLRYGGHSWAAYVVQHVSGAMPSLSECEAGIEKLRNLEKQGLLKVVLPDGFEDEEFACPTCSGNTLIDHDGNFRYVDFQNFLLVDYQSFLTRVAVEASKKTHFGDKLLLRGGSYLYQSVPGVTLPAKRNVEERMAAFRGLMEAAAVSVRDRLVLDVGCNIGMMMAQYLMLGAKWCHGWDREQIVPYTEQMLLALGCTRFSTSGTEITQGQQLEENLPSFLAPSLNGCVISYLAIRGHVGWLEALSRISWSFLLYEGHEGESQADFVKYMVDLEQLTDFQLGGVSSYVDGDSEARMVAILVRN